MAAQASFPTPTTIQVARDGTIPTLQVSVGQAQAGLYDAIIWPRTGRPRRIGRGSTLDDLPDTHRIVRTRQQLLQTNGFVITCVIGVQAVQRAPGARWSSEIVISQDGNVLERDEDGGPIDQALIAVHHAYIIELI